jgi:hypothetical protein
MSVRFVQPVKTSTYRVPPKPVSADYLRGPGSLRVQHLMYLYGCSQSAIYRKLREGRIPAPAGNDPRPYWANEVIRQHLGISKG